MIQKKEIIQHFQKLGLKSGDLVLVHSSWYRALDRDVKSPKEIIDALLEVVGEKGTIIFPTFNFDNANLYYMGAYPMQIGEYNYISFSHFFRNKILPGFDRKYFDKHTKIMLSKDGIFWDEIGAIFKQDAMLVTESRDSHCPNSSSVHLGPPHVISMDDRGEDLTSFVLEGYQTSKVQITEYSISKLELLEKSKLL